MKIITYIFKLIKTEWRLQLLGFIFGVLTTFASICAGYTLKILIDDVLLAGNVSMLWNIQFIFLGVVFLQLVFTVLRTKFFYKASNLIVGKLRRNYTNKLLHLSFDHKIRQSSGDVISSYNYDVSGIESVISEGIPEFIGSIVSIVITFSVMCAINLRLALLTVIVYPLLILIFRGIQKKLEKYSDKLQSSRSSMNKILGEFVFGLATFRIFGAQPALDRIRAQTSEMQNNYYGLRFMGLLQNLSSWMMVMVPFQAIMYGVAGSWYFADGSPSIGVMLVFANYTNSLIGPVLTIINIAASMTNASVCHKRLEEFMNLPEERSGEKSLDEILGVGSERLSISVENLNFSYEGQNKVIENISFSAKKGDLISLYGASGKGKSTLLKILCGFLEYSSGSVKIAGIEVAELSLDSLWSNVAYVFQDTFVIDAPIHSNITLMDDSISDSKVKEAIKMVNLESIDSEENDSCLTLSGGERRRLGLARALTREPKILLLDEPTSELDRANAESIRELISKLAKDYIVVVATHDSEFRDISTKVITL